MRINGIPGAGLAALQRLMLGALPRANAAVGKVEIVAPTAPMVPLAHSQTSVEMLIAIAATDPEARRRRASAAAEQGIGGLERLLEADRLGRSPIARLEELAAWVGEHEVPDDETAQRLVRDVELRVLVELAKRQPPPPT